MCQLKFHVQITELYDIVIPQFFLDNFLIDF